MVSVLLLLFATRCEVSGTLTLSCTFGRYEYKHVGRIYECIAKTELFGENDEKVAAISGIHLNGMTNVDVQGLDISFNSLKFFPQNIESFFPNLKVLYCAVNSVSYISNYHLVPFPNLVYIDLRGNKISSLDSNVFYGLTALKRIDFRYNNIKHVGYEFILPETGEIKFNSNVCIDRDAFTADEINYLKFALLVNCPPTISQIETSLASRPNFITKVNAEIHNFAKRTDEMDDEIRKQSNELSTLRFKNFRLENRIAKLEAIISGKLGLKIEA